MSLFSPEISTKAMVGLCRQLATSYGAGIPILRSLELVAGNVSDRRTREVLLHMHDDIRRGSTLAQAARNQSPRVPRLFIELLASGEVGGRLDVMLRDLADYYEDRLNMQRAVVRSMAYPAIQLVIAWFLGTFALMLIRRMSLVREFNLSGYLRFYLSFQAAAMLIFASIGVGCVVLARMGMFKWVWGWAATYLWPLAPVTRRFGLARFFRSLSFLVGSGMPIGRAIESAASVTANPYMERDLSGAAPRVATGVTLVEAFAPCRFLSPETREMLHVGEETGKLEEASRKAAQYQMEEATHAVNLAARIGGIVVGLGVAVLVGYIVISFYSRYIGMIDEITR